MLKMSPWVRHAAWLVVALAVIVLVSVIAGGVYVRRQLNASLPVLQGTVALRGLEAAVTVTRDSLGIPTISASSRRDAARALGFLHAQDRFFQMDLQRRQAAGELSALVGVWALELDRSIRVHRFRHVSQQAFARTTPPYRAVLEAYAAGVNDGLNALGAAPIEYFVLGSAPQSWKPEDSLLTILAMFNTLQGRQAAFEATFGTMADTMPAPLYDFLSARGSEWDAPITGGRFTRPPIPSRDVFDLRADTQSARALDREITRSPDHQITNSPAHQLTKCLWPPCLSPEEVAGLGSNNWAVAGSHTASGAALLANDMHLSIGVPNIWYRASIKVDDRTTGETSTLNGVTLPGLPSLVVGSNGHVAWGFTNTGGDWSDLIVVEPDPRQKDRYLSPQGSQAIEVIEDSIDVANGPNDRFQSRWTVWGPIVRRDHHGREIAQQWVAHDPALLASDMTAPERVKSVDDALAAAAGLGIPAQNFVVADSSGRIGWTIAGPIPRRVGFDGSRPTSWADGSRRWDGFLSPEEFPRVADPPSGRIWTANAPVVEGEMLAAIGEGGYADPIRARLIRDRLLTLEKAQPSDMLAIQLDDTALFLDRWRTLVLAMLTPEAVQGDGRRAEFRRLVETTWNGRADPSSVAYRLVRTFRSQLSRDVFNAITVAARRAEADFDFTRALRSEGPLWQLVVERPLHLLDPKYPSWDAQLLAAVDEAIAELTERGGRLPDRSWGDFNRAVVVHPLGNALPLIGRWVNMPADPLPGDVYTPRAHSPRAGPSERMVVSPGREQEGIFHMPTGQSGHPMSPHYADQHRAWVTGQPLPFLPGPAVSTLTLVPAATQ